MNSLRKVVGFLMVLLLAAFALPAVAAPPPSNDKQYTQLMTVPQATSPAKVHALFTNNGNSSFNSLRITAPNGWVITAVDQNSFKSDNLKKLGVGIGPVGGQSVDIYGINLPQGTGHNFEFDMTVTKAACGSQEGVWSSLVYSGTPVGSGFVFKNLSTGTANLKTTVSTTCPTVTGVADPTDGGTVSCTQPLSSGGSSVCTATVNDTWSFTGFSPSDLNTCSVSSLTCTLSNVTADTTVTGSYTRNTLSVSGPGTTVAAGESFNIEVNLTPAPTSVNVSVSGSGCVLTSPTTSVNVTESSATIAVTIKPINPPGNQNCTLNVSAANYFGTSLQLSSVYGGVLGCTGGTSGHDNYNSINGASIFTFDPDNTLTPQSDGWGLRRGANYIESECIKVAYTFTPPTTANGNLASMLYDRSTGQSASWKYLITWPNIDVESSGPNKGWTTFRPWLSWGIDSPNTAANSPDFVPALFCLNDPGDLALRNVTELAALLPTMPDDCETLGGTPVGTLDGPFCKAYRAHQLVYPLGGKAKMCVSEQGLLTDPNKLFPWTEIVDQADGYAKLPQ